MSGDERHCDWCGYFARRIGTVETGMLRGVASVWLCIWADCGHEMEVMDGDLPLAYWRDQLIEGLTERAWDLFARAQAERFAQLSEFQNK